MIKYIIINNIVDEDAFRNEFVNEMPESWEANLEFKDHDYTISVNDIAEEHIEAAENL